MRLWLALLSFTLLIVATLAAAQNPVRRCVGADGHPVFTDQPCASMHATPVAPVAPVEPVTPVPDAAPIDAPLPILCAANLDELKQSVAEAFAGQDANRLAGLMLWSGYGQRAVVAEIRQLDAMVRQTLLDVGEVDPIWNDNGFAPAFDPFATPEPTTPSAPSDQLVLDTVDRDGAPHEWPFRIARSAGCLWLRSP